MSETWLTPEEVFELTAKVRHKAQCKALAEMGIPFQPNAIGRPLVDRSVVLSSKPTRHKKEPHWEAARGKAA